MTPIPKCKRTKGDDKKCEQERAPGRPFCDACSDEVLTSDLLIKLADLPVVYPFNITDGETLESLSEKYSDQLVRWQHAKDKLSTTPVLRLLSPNAIFENTWRLTVIGAYYDAFDCIRLVHDAVRRDIGVRGALAISRTLLESYAKLRFYAQDIDRYFWDFLVNAGEVQYKRLKSEIDDGYPLSPDPEWEAWKVEVEEYKRLLDAHGLRSLQSAQRKLDTYTQAQMNALHDYVHCGHSSTTNFLKQTSTNYIQFESPNESKTFALLVSMFSTENLLKLCERIFPDVLPAGG